MQSGLGPANPVDVMAHAPTSITRLRANRSVFGFVVWGHTMPASAPFKSLLRFRQVREIVPLSRSEIYRRIALGQFPRPVKLGERAVAWDSDQIQAYVRDKLGGRGTA